MSRWDEIMETVRVNEIAAEMRKYAEDQESRYRENQVREGWKKERSTDVLFPSSDRELFAKLGRKFGRELE